MPDKINIVLKVSCAPKLTETTPHVPIWNGSTATDHSTLSTVLYIAWEV